MAEVFNEIYKLPASWISVWMTSTNFASDEDKRGENICENLRTSFW